MHIHNVTHLDTLGTEKLRTLISDFRASRIHIHMYIHVHGILGYEKCPVC